MEALEEEVADLPRRFLAALLEAPGIDEVVVSEDSLELFFAARDEHEG